MANTATVGILRILLTANAAEFEQGLSKAAAAAKVWEKDLKAIGRQASDVGAMLTKTITLPIAGLAATSIKAAMDFESSFAGIRKTVDGVVDSAGELTDFGREVQQSMRDLAKEIPVNVNELNRLGEAAGALGIPKEEIVDFAKVMAQLGVTTNLTSDQAADAIARIQNIFGAAGKDTDRLASTIVALGNAGASTEKEIVEMAQRIAGAGHSVGLTQAQVLAFASTLASVGINAEAGGSAISRIFLKMNDAVMGGGKNLEEFARVAGVSAAEFKRVFESDAAQATVLFINGLNRLKTEGENTNATMEGLIGKNIILKDTLNRLAGSGQLLTQQLALGNKAWQENTALTKEAEQRFKTFESQLTLVWNQIKDVGITIGTALLPTLRDLLTIVQPLIGAAGQLAQGFAAMPEPIRLAMLGALGLAAAIGPVTFVAGQAITALGTLAGTMTAKGIAMRGLTAAYPALTAATAAHGTTAATAAVGVNALKLAFLGLGQAFAAIMVVGGSVILVSRALEQAGKLAAESAERDAMAANEQARRYAMMAQAAQIAGHSIHSYADAVVIVTEHARKLADAQKDFVGPENIGAWEGPLLDTAAAARQTRDRAAEMSAELAKVRAEVAALSPTQRRAIEDYKELGKSVEETARELGLSNDVVEMYRKSLEKTGKTAEQVAEGPFKRLQTRIIEVNAQLTAAIAEGPRAYEIALEELGGTLEEVGKRAQMFGKELPEPLKFSVRIVANKQAIRTEVDRLADSLQQWWQTRMTTVQLVSTLDLSKTFQPYAAAMGQMVDGVWKPAKGNLQGRLYGNAIVSGLTDVLKNVPNLLTAAFTGGGGFMGALKGLGVQLGTAVLGPLTQSLGKSIGGLFGGGKIAGAIGSSIASFGISAAVIGVGMLAQKWFGVSAEVKKARQEVDNFQKSLANVLTAEERAEANGEQWRETILAVSKAYQSTGRSAEEARQIIEQLWDTDHPDRARAAMEQINAVMKEFAQRTKAAGTVFDDIMRLAQEAGNTIPAHLRPVIDEFISLGLLTDEQIQRLRALGDESGPTWEQMKTDAERFGINLDALGQRFQQLRANASFEDILNVWDRLTRGGADQGGVAQGLREEISAAVNEARRLGTAVPENMRHLVEELARTGQLYSDNRLKAMAWADEALKGSTELPGALRDVIAAFKETGQLTMSADELMRRFGDRAPESVRRIIEELIRQSEVLGETGGQITDLGDLKFGEPIKTEAEIAKEGWEQIIAAIRELIGEIRGPLLQAIARVPREVPIDFVGTFVPPDTTTQPVPFARGGLVTRPTFALLGEAGPELVVPLRSAFAGLRSSLTNAFDFSAVRMPDFAFDTPGVPGGRVEFDTPAEPRYAQRATPAVMILPVAIPPTDRDDDIRDAVSLSLADDLASDRNGMRRRMLPMLVQGVKSALQRGGRR